MRTVPRHLAAVVAVVALLVAACAPEVEDPLEDEPVDGPVDEEPVDDEPVAEGPGLVADEGATIVELLAGHEAFTELVAAIDAAGLEGELSAAGELTVFAPTDDAFALLPEHEHDALLEDTGLLEQVVLAHVAEGGVTAEALTDGDTLTKLDGTARSVLVTDAGEVFVGSAQVIEADVRASNGIVHVIDFVLPSAPAEPEEAEDADE